MDLETVIEDVGHAVQEPCPICGSSDFIVEGGFYYCSICNTQSQVSRLYVEEEFRQERQYAHRAAVFRGEKRRKELVEDTRRHLSAWEIWNVVLKNLADRLIEIGFPELIRAKIFHIYVSFMMKRKVIFVSASNPEAKSRITVGEPKANLYALYGFKRTKKAKDANKRKNLLKKQVNVPSGISKEALGDGHDGLFKRPKMLSKRKAMEKEYLAKEKDIPAVDVNEFDNIIQKETSGEKSKEAGTQGKEKDPQPIYTKSTKKLLGAKLLTTRSLKTGILQRSRRKQVLSSLKRYVTSAKLLKYERFSLSTCLITVFVALRELGFPIVMTDILRLNLLGILHIDNIKRLVNQIEEYEDAQFIGFPVPSCPYQNIQHWGEDVHNFVEYIGINKFCYPRIKEIVPKYIDEFVLPREFECLINVINHILTFDDCVNDFPKTMHVEQFRAVPEVIVLVQFLVLLKMLFGLDDKTEKFQSRFAQIVNKILKEETEKRKWEMEEWAELFVIEDWFGYLQRRRQVVRREMCCPSMYTPNEPPGIIKLNDLMEKCAINDEQNRHETATMKAKDEAAESCKALFEEILKENLPEGGREIPKIKPYIPLPLPNESVIQQYIERYPAVVDQSIKPDCLKVNFVQKRIDFLWNPKKYVKLLKLRGYDVKIIHGDAINNYPIELNEDTQESKVVYVFQPYKSYDEFIGRVREVCSTNMKFLLQLCEDIVPGMSQEKNELKHSEPLIQKLVNGLGDIYIKRVLTELIPVMTRWEEDDESDSD